MTICKQCTIYCFNAQYLGSRSVPIRRRRYDCGDCDKSFTSTQSLKRHATAHGAQKPTFTCTCGKEYTSKFGLSHHIRTVHHGIVLKCDVRDCLFTGSAKEQMSAHMRSAHDMEKLKCTQCDATFNHASTLSKHVKQVHGPSALVACGTCNMTFASNTLLGEHSKSAHGPGRYVCHVCGKIFKWRSSLRSHNQHKHNA